MGKARRSVRAAAGRQGGCAGSQAAQGATRSRRPTGIGPVLRPEVAAFRRRRPSAIGAPIGEQRTRRSSGASSAGTRTVPLRPLPRRAERRCRFAWKAPTFEGAKRPFERNSHRCEPRVSRGWLVGRVLRLLGHEPLRFQLPKQFRLSGPRDVFQLPAASTARAFQSAHAVYRERRFSPREPFLLQVSYEAGRSVSGAGNAGLSPLDSLRFPARTYVVCRERRFSL